MTQALERTPTHDTTDTDTGAVFTTTRGVLADALATVGAAIHTRPAVPVLAGVLLRSHGPDLMVTGFDYDTAITVRVPDAVATPGTLLVRHRELHKLMGALVRGTTKKRADAMRATVMGRDAGFATLTLAQTTVPVERLPLADYPELPKAPPVFARADSGEFVSQLKRVMPAVGREDTLPMLTGVKLNPTRNGLLIAGSDRYRLAVGHVVATLSTEAPDDVLVNGFMLRKIAPKLSGAGTLSLGYGTSTWYSDVIELDTGRVSIISRSHNNGQSFAEGARYLDLFPRQVNTTVTLDRKALLTSAEKAHAVMTASDQPGSPITLTVGGSTVQVAPRLGLGDHFVITPEIPAEVSGPAYDVIGLNPKYFCEALASSAFTGATVTLHIASPTKPIVLTDEGELFDDPTTYRHMVMPLRLT